MFGVILRFFVVFFYKIAFQTYCVHCIMTFFACVCPIFIKYRCVFHLSTYFAYFLCHFQYLSLRDC